MVRAILEQKNKHTCVWEWGAPVPKQRRKHACGCVVIVAPTFKTHACLWFVEWGAPYSHISMLRDVFWEWGAPFSTHMSAELILRMRRPTLNKSTHAYFVVCLRMGRPILNKNKNICVGNGALHSQQLACSIVFENWAPHPQTHIYSSISANTHTDAQTHTHTHTHTHAHTHTHTHWKNPPLNLNKNALKTSAGAKTWTLFCYLLHKLLYPVHHVLQSQRLR